MPEAQHNTQNRIGQHSQHIPTARCGAPQPQVLTWDDKGYIAQLTRCGIQATGWPWDDQADQKKMFDAVADGTFDALMLDSYVLEHGAHMRCDMTVVGPLFDQERVRAP